ncbi:MAG: ATP-binding cassette domain-containing protein [Nitrospiraceae bacterium]|nr:ATP-binding cassette domain-containing protein [Nitrospiraceae bacterium]
MKGISVNLFKKVHGFTLDVGWQSAEGITVIFGHSGSGKSTTLDMIAGFQLPDSGAITVNDKKLFESASGLNIPVKKRGLGYVSQDPALFPHMSVRQNIAYGHPKLDKASLKRTTDEMLHVFGVEKLEHSRPAQISGGQKKRVALARALIGQPAALLLDEPFSGLDHPSRAGFGKLLIEIREKFGIPVLMVTHNAAEAMELAGKVIVYSNGKIEIAGEPREVFAALSGQTAHRPPTLGSLSRSTHRRSS